LRQALVAPQLPPTPITYEDFLAWADEDVPAEWVKGEIVLMSPAALIHQQLVTFLTKVMGIYVEEKKLGIVVSAPFQVKLTHSGREPDIFFVAEVNRHRLQATFMDGPPDLVVEVISPESIGRDRGDKYREYEAAGIPEYWLLDPERQVAEFYRLGENDRYALHQPDTNNRYPSPVIPGFWLQVDWLWQTPPALDILRQLQVV
jgi:Uma2 family endonuclease